MSDMQPQDVASTFEVLLEAVEAEIDFVNGVGSRSFESRDYERAKSALERAASLTAFRDKVVALRREWDDITALSEQQEDEATKAERRNLGRLRRGVRTPDKAFVLPLLQVLMDVGGAGKAAEVLDRLGKLMKPVLKDVDFDPLASDTKNLRWRNTAQWARNMMVRDGLLKPDSPRGVWEITESGRRLALEQGGFPR